MKTALAIVLVLLALFVFALFHGKSIDRANLVNSANALLVAHEELRQHGNITNASSYTRVIHWLRG